MPLISAYRSSGKRQTVPASSAADAGDCPPASSAAATASAARTLSTPSAPDRRHDDDGRYQRPDRSELCDE